jgi:4-alpha-glucanotransferase
MLNERASGILLHPTSLPGPIGSGDLGQEAYRFVDWLRATGQRYWQMLPVGEIGPGNSPYMSSSSFAGNVLLVDLQELAILGWLSQEDLLPSEELTPEKVNFGTVIPYRMARLRIAFSRFKSSIYNDLEVNFNLFCKQQDAWLNDYATFMTITGLYPEKLWSEWPEELIQRSESAIRQIQKHHADEIKFWQFVQWCFDRQWHNLKQYANTNGVRLIGDVPIFVAYHSADVWSNQALFNLDNHGKPLTVAGVPPDYFSETGQLWGNPLYLWETHANTGYAWWIARMRRALDLTDVVRVDHFRGFAGFWEIPAASPTAIEGRWVIGPGARFFEALKAAIPELPIIAEDLGVITQDVIDLREEFQLPGMRVLQFAFGGSEDNPFLPENYVENCVAYTGTHDNSTTVGWWEDLPQHERENVMRYLNTDGSEINWAMISALQTSIANTVVIPLQDVMGLNDEHRMNFPGKLEGNWSWRFRWTDLKHADAVRLYNLTQESGRASN